MKSEVSCKNPIFGKSTYAALQNHQDSVLSQKFVKQVVTLIRHTGGRRLFQMALKFLDSGSR